ncbi:hypothetical protein FQA39_LY16438 [Lamprigera yunnana]|nr:hypothetical protein FQA39_LY16438 [Lamprigera yunnana]
MLTLRKKWVNAINRLNFSPTSNTRVCELHFQQYELERVTKFDDEKTVKLLTAPLDQLRLVNECERIQNVIAMSIESDKSYNDRKAFTSVNELRSKLGNIDLGNWVTTNKNNWVYFFYVDNHTLKPTIKCFVCIFEDLTLSVYSGDVEITSLPGNPRLEQNESGFLHYASAKFKLLNVKDKTVVLMVDEIHIKPYMDNKGGNIVGSAFNSYECATSAHVFMINSVLSTYKDVVHIISVTTLNADMVHNFIKRIILGLENIGFEVLAVTDNSINRKAMAFFSGTPVLYLNTYSHPKDAARPLLCLVDTYCIFNEKHSKQLVKPKTQISKRK